MLRNPLRSSCERPAARPIPRSAKRSGRTAPSRTSSPRAAVLLATAPLRGLFAHMKGGFYHDGRFPTLLDVVNHYNQLKKLNLTAAEKNDLVEFLKSL